MFSETSFSNDELLNGKSDVIADSINKSSIIEQHLYDLETEHSNNKEKQVEWNNKIAKELEELKKYNETTVTGDTQRKVVCLFFL